MTVGCTCELSGVYLHGAQTLHKLWEKDKTKPTNQPTKPSCTLTQAQSAAVDISHMAVISSMSTGSFVCMCVVYKDVGVNHHSPP